MESGHVYISGEPENRAIVAHLLLTTVRWRAAYWRAPRPGIRSRRVLGMVIGKKVTRPLERQVPNGPNEPVPDNNHVELSLRWTKRGLKYYVVRFAEAGVRYEHSINVVPAGATRLWDADARMRRRTDATNLTRWKQRSHRPPRRFFQIFGNQ